MLKKLLGPEEYMLRLPWPPTVNHYHQPVIINGKPRIIKSKKVREYLKKTIHLVYRQRLAELNIEGLVIVQINLHPPTLHEYDCDNRPKAILDTLSNANFWGDDKQVKTLLLDKCEKQKGGYVDIFVWRC